MPSKPLNEAINDSIDAAISKLKITHLGPRHGYIFTSDRVWYFSYNTIIAYAGPIEIPAFGIQTVKVRMKYDWPNFKSIDGVSLKLTRRHIKELGLENFTEISAEVFKNTVP